MNRERNTIHTKLVRTAGVSALVAMTLAFAPTVLAGVTPEQKCEAGKNGAAGKYASCLLKAQSKFVRGGEVDTAGYDAAVLKCDDTYGGKWQSLETKADGMCPSTGDETSIQDFLDACILSAQNALGGDTLPSDVVACNADLGTCTGSLGTCNSSLTTCQGDLSSTNADLASCTADLAACEAASVCGDGAIEGSESCDGANLGGASCSSLGYAAGSLGCSVNCRLDLSGCDATTCGDSVVQAPESCDGSALNGASCSSLGYASGTLACTAGCGYDVSGCEGVVCGNGQVDPGEECDWGDVGDQTCFGRVHAGTGTLYCAPGCTIDESQCAAGKFVFVTEATFSANFGGVVEGDAACAAEALSAGLPGTFKAWLSDGTTSPASSFSHSSTPYLLPSGTKVADDWADLTDGSLDNSIREHASGAFSGYGATWTGTDSAGNPSGYDCLDWTSTDAAESGTAGGTVATDGTWSSLDVSFFPFPCDGWIPYPMHLYCFEQ